MVVPEAGELGWREYFGGDRDGRTRPVNLFEAIELIMMLGANSIDAVGGSRVARYTLQTG
jgi:hypothetical protein